MTLDEVVRMLAEKRDASSCNHIRHDLVNQRRLSTSLFADEVNNNFSWRRDNATTNDSLRRGSDSAVYGNGC